MTKTKLEKILEDQEILIKFIAKKIGKSAYQTGQKIKKNNFNVREVNIILEVIQFKYEDVF